MTIIGSRTRLVGLVGYPVAHSVSPAMQNAAFLKLGLDYAYLPLQVAPNNHDSVAQAVQGLRALGFVGANVTVPHKTSVIQNLDKISDAALAIGAVNTIKISGEIIEGDNTDWTGFSKDLKHNGINTSDCKVLLLGAGGAARGVAYALCADGAKKVTILARNQSKASRLASGLSKRFGKTNIESDSFSQSLNEKISHSDLVINCTPVGMNSYKDAAFTANEDPVNFSPSQIYYDLVYTPKTTPLMKRALECGSIALGGLGMLVWQGAESFEIWTGQKAPIDTMFRAAKDALTQNNETKD